jgi:hypothetical protein
MVGEGVEHLGRGSNGGWARGEEVGNEGVSPGRNCFLSRPEPSDCPTASDHSDASDQSGPSDHSDAKSPTVLNFSEQPPPPRHMETWTPDTRGYVHRVKCKVGVMIKHMKHRLAKNFISSPMDEHKIVNKQHWT